MAMANASARRCLAALLPLICRPLPALLPPPPSDLRPMAPQSSNSLRRFSSRPKSPPFSKRARQNKIEDEYESDYESSSNEEGEEGSDPRRARGKTDEYKAAEAEEIGYRVVGPLDPSENPFKPYEPVFAVVQIGSHQFKVSNRDSIFTERLKNCEVNDKLVLSKILMLGSTTQTIIGRPILTEAAVHAVVEEHALDAKVLIFKKKRRKNYRRCNGHRQELTKLRITDIQGIEKPINVQFLHSSNKPSLETETS